MKKSFFVTRLQVFFFILCGWVTVESTAQTPSLCHGQFLTQTFSHLKAEDFFPITLGSTTVESGTLPDTPNPSSPVCACGDFPDIHVGAAVGYWEPIGVVDVTRTPYCLVNMGGEKLSTPTSTAQGSVDTQSPDQNGGFYEVHYYDIPFLKKIVGGIFGGACLKDADLPLPYFSELDPSWHDETLANTIFPEAAAFAHLLSANPLASVQVNALCGAESVKVNRGGLPIDSLFWCGGSQGLLYPLTGKVAEVSGLAQSSTLMTERLLLKLHHLFLIGNSSPDNLCEQSPTYRLAKSRYRYQMAYPSPESAEPLGRSTMLWGINANDFHLEKGDDAAFIIWRKHNCCSF